MYLEPEQAPMVEKYPALGQMRGIISNNLGISHFFQFVALSETVQDPSQISADKVKPIIDNLNSAIRNIKKSVLYLEQLDERLASLN